MNWMIWLMAAALLINGLRLRHRVTGLHRLQIPRAAPAPTGYLALTAEDAAVPDRVLRAAADHARRHGIGMLDLVPRDLPAEQALDLIRNVDPRAYREDRFGMGRGAGYAVLVDEEGMARSGIDPRGGLDAGEMGEATARVRLHVDTADMAVAPFPGTDRTAQRRAWLRSQALDPPPALTLPRTLYGTGGAWLLVLTGPLIELWTGLGLVLLYCLIPYLIFVGTPLRPADLHRAAWLRPVRTPLTIWRTLRAPRSRWERRQIERREEARARYAAEIAAGVERRLGERRPDCPWCGSPDLVRHLVARDTVQAKPGRFRLDRCRGCGHVFQNPRLTPEGLDFYDRDVCDGLGDLSAELIFSSAAEDCLRRARLAERFTAPRRWLDVGTGKGHFCRVARTVFPDTEFDGLDVGDGVEDAARRGWIDHAYRSSFLDVGPDLIGRYDMISMHRYLERTPDPLAELDLAAKILEPGGHLLIETPDPQCPMARLLRGLWPPYRPPRSLHMIPPGNLKRALEIRGFQILAEQRRGSRRGTDVASAAAALVDLIGPDAERPWQGAAPPGPARHVRALTAQLLAVPLVGLGMVADLLTLPLQRGSGDAYLLIARKIDDSRPVPAVAEP